MVQGSLSVLPQYGSHSVVISLSRHAAVTSVLITLSRYCVPRYALTMLSLQCSHCSHALTMLSLHAASPTTLPLEASPTVLTTLVGLFYLGFRVRVQGLGVDQRMAGRVGGGRSLLRRRRLPLHAPHGV